MLTKILVIEDEDPLREEIVDMLRFEGYDVKEAPNGKIGVQLAREYLPDLVLSDIVMPEYDGYRVLLELRADPGTAIIPFVFLTAKADRKDWRYGIEVGADDYLTKPFTRDELLSAIRTRMEKQAAIQSHSESKLGQMRDAILYSLPHELRTPLGSIMGFSSLLRDADEMDLEEVREISGIIMKASERLYRVTENYLLYSQIQLMRTNAERVQSLRQQSVESPGAIVGEVATRKASLAGRESDLVLEAKSPPAYVTHDNLVKIAEELIENAFKFSAPGKAVHVTLDANEDFVFIHIKNEGRGMTPEQIARVGAYLQFEREHYEQQGLGLGLSIARGLAELHGGSLTIDCVPGQEITVTVMLPRAEEISEESS